MSGKYALIIGNSDYSDPGLAKLTAPGKDAADFARILQDRNICGFDQVRTLSNELSSAVIEAMDDFFDQKKPDDFLVLYFSGHGIRDEFGSLYLAFKNTVRSRLRSTAIKAEYIREAMDQSRSKRQLLILDCCNSGAFPQGAKAEVGGAMGMVSTFQGYGRYVLTASDATQYAWEGDKVIGGTQNSLFTHFLIKGLEGAADRDSDGRISIDELYDYAFDEISRATPQQTPTKSASKQEGDIILRQITRLQDIRPVALPEELLEAIDDSRTFVRVSAVEELDKLLRGRNLGLARSARAALEKVTAQDDSTRVRQLAAQSLKSLPEPALAVVPQEAPSEQPSDQHATEAVISEKPRASVKQPDTTVVEQAPVAQPAEPVSVPANATATDRPVQREEQPDRVEMRAATPKRGLSAWMNIAGPGEARSNALIRIGAAGAAVVVIALIAFFVLRSIGAASRQSSTPPTSSPEASVLSASSATTAPVAVVAGSATSDAQPGLPTISFSTSTPSNLLEFTPIASASAEAISAQVTPNELCDSWIFIEDMNIPDGTLVSPGQMFIKTWKVKNNGACTWGAGYQLVYGGYADRMSGVPQPLTEAVVPGQDVEISVQFQAPDKAGDYISAWRMANPRGIPFGNPVYVKIVVQ